MSSVQKRGRNSKESDKRGSAKRLDETPSVNETKGEIDEQVECSSPVAEELTVPTEEPAPKPPTPEPVYEEPVLTQLIVQSFSGAKERGLYEGDGEASFTGGHDYKGEFSCGLMHGHGKYTWKDGLVYEGEFAQNRVTGKGTYTWPDGSTYEGDVCDGLRHGFGTFRVNGGKLSYTGEWHYGKRNGKGRMTYDADGISFYEGDWVENIRQGWGTRQYPSGNVYQGMWFKNIRHGEGTMRWLDRDQMYTGQWENGVQHGIGQHIWFLHRVQGSQYPLRNMYDGDFVKGLRNGMGTFFYANGARYEGEWSNNMKHGKGKFIFKNGRVYEGVFEKDHIMEFPSFQMDGASTPDLTQIRTRTPLQSEQMSIRSNESRNTYSPSYQLEVGSLLEEFTESDRVEEATQVIFVIMRYITNLRTVYNYYSGLGYEESPDNTFVMSRMQFWRFVKDCRLHYRGMSLSEMDDILMPNPQHMEEVHNPYAKILFREYVNNLVTLAYHLYHEDHRGTGPVLSWCLSQLISNNLLIHGCNVQGYIYTESRRSVNAIVHLDQAYEVFKAHCVPKKKFPHTPVLKMRQFLFLIKDLHLINHDLTSKAVIDILSSDDPNVADSDGCLNLELEMTFLEFFEGLVGCAQVFVTEAVVKDPTTPRPSTSLTATGEQSIIGSETASPSRNASQVALEDGGEDGMGGTLSPTHQGVLSEGGSPVPRAGSHMSHKTADRSVKAQEQQISNTTVGSGASEVEAQASHHTHVHSARKSDLTLADQKKSASFISTHSIATEGGEVGIAQSVVSLGAVQSEAGGEYPIDDEELDELDDATRQFNFWTHQVHIFFVRKFFPAAQHYAIIKHKIEERYTRLDAQAAALAAAAEYSNEQAGSLSVEEVDDTKSKLSENGEDPNDGVSHGDHTEAESFRTDV